MDSILTSIKKLLGIVEEYTQFDTDVIMHINSAFSVLTQLGVGPDGGFSISDAETTWSDYIPDADRQKIEMLRSYVYLKVRLIFDPPSSSAIIEAMNRQISEFEWRLNVAVDSKEENRA